MCEKYDEQKTYKNGDIMKAMILYEFNHLQWMLCTEVSFLHPNFLFFICSALFLRMSYNIVVRRQHICCFFVAGYYTIAYHCMNYA